MVFFADHSELINSLSNGSDGIPWLWPIIVFFFALVSLTIMYMLVGVLVDVIGVVATSEKERIEVGYVAGVLRHEFHRLGRHTDSAISQDDFLSIMGEPGVLEVIQSVGVDINVLADMLDLLFDDASKKKGGVMHFQDLVSMVLNMRGTNPATVKDCKEQIRVTKSIITLFMEDLSQNMERGFTMLASQIHSIEADQYSEDDKDSNKYPWGDPEARNLDDGDGGQSDESL